MWDSDRLDPSLQDDHGADVRARAVRLDDLPPPLAAVDDTATTDEDTAVTIEVLVNDTGADPLTVLDARGREVARLLAGESLSEGRHELRWQGIDHAGRAVASGVYRVRLDVGRETDERALVLVR